MVIKGLERVFKTYKHVLCVSETYACDFWINTIPQTFIRCSLALSLGAIRMRPSHAKSLLFSKKTPLPSKITTPSSLARSPARSLARSLARSFARSIARSLNLSLARSLGRSLARSLARSLDRSLARSSASYSSLVLKASSVKTLTGERGLKNPIQRTTFHLQRSSGARVMVGFVFAKFLFFTAYFRKV